MTTTNGRDVVVVVTWRFEPITRYIYRQTGPISREEVEDFCDGVVPEGRWVL